MKKRTILLALAVVLLMGLLVTMALASGNDYGNRDCYSYSELVDALNDPTAIDITIHGKKMISVQPDEYEPFQWDHSGETTLVLLPANSSADITVQDDWTIPVGVDVEIHRNLNTQVCDTITVNGDWTIKDNAGIPYAYNTTMVFNGNVYNEVRANYENVNKIVLNGTAQLDEVWMVNNIEMGPGAKVTGAELEVNGELSVPNGTLSIGTISFGYNSNASVSGCVNAERLNFSSGTVTIASNSRVKSADNYCGSGNGAIVVNGLWEMTDGYQNIGNNPILVNEGGTLILRPGTQLGSETTTGSVSGDGTLKLYAEIRQEEDEIWYDSYPKLYSISADRYISEKVTVSHIWKNWVDAKDCEHDYVIADVIPATCNEYGKIICECSKCGSQNIQENVEGGLSNEHNWSWYAESDGISMSCRRCHKYGKATLVTPNGKYTGNPVTPAYVETNEDWSGSVSLSYQNNVDVGEGTAAVTMTCNGLSVTKYFSIYADCAHNGGTATCYAKAVCTVCGKEYGTLLKHAFTGEWDYDSSSHFRRCKNKGCTEKETKAHVFYSSDVDYEMGIGNGTGPTSHSCMVCGYGRINSSSVHVQDTTVSLTIEQVAEGDTMVAAVYSEEGQFLGFDLKTAEEKGKIDLTVDYTGEADLLKVFCLPFGYVINRPAAEFDLSEQ